MIMLIDDDKDDCDIFCEAAQKVSSCKCHCVNNAVDALTILHRTDKLPDCIFLDLNMPILNGVEVLDKLKSSPKLSSIPVVIYSTTSSPQEAQECLNMGADRFLRKTSDFNQLIGQLRNIKTDLLDL